MNRIVLLLLVCAAGCPAQVTVTVNPGITYQTWHNWYALSMNGPGPNGAGIVPADPNWNTFEGQFWSVLVQQLGINTLMVVAHSGDIENIQDYFTPNVIGNGNAGIFGAHWFTPVNDNGDPGVFNCSDSILVSCPSTFPMGEIDFQIASHWIGPAGMKAIVEATGRKAHLSLTWVTNASISDFTTTTPVEAAEHIAAIFIHIRNKYGVSPDILNIQNEPDLKSTWTPSSVGATAAAVKARLNNLGFYPVIECCSTNTYVDAVTWYTQAKAAAGSGVIDVLSAHNYGGNNLQMQAVQSAALADGIYNTMNESDGGNIGELFYLMLNAHPSGYVRYSAASYASRHGSCSYIQVDSTVPFSYHYTIGNESGTSCENGPEYYYPQVMHYVHEGAVMESAITNDGAWTAMAFRGPDNEGHVVSVVTFNTGSPTLRITGLPAGTYGCTWTTRQTTIMAPCGPNQTIAGGGVLSTTQAIPPAEYPAHGNTTAVFTFFLVSGSQSQTIAFSGMNDVSVGGAPFTIAATASSGLAVSFESTTPSVCLVAGATVTIVGGGACSITASQPGNGTFGAATPVTQSFTVDAASGGPTITAGGIVPLFSSSQTIQPGSWVSIYGSNLASTTATWNGDFPTALGGVTVMINGKKAYLWYVSPAQINLQAPDDTARGIVSVTVSNAKGSWTSTVTLGQFGPSFSVLDGRHVTGIILRSDGSGTYGGGTYDIIGPTGTSLGYKTVAAKPGDVLELFGVGFGPTSPPVPSGQLFLAAAPTANPVQLTIGGTTVAPFFSGLSSAGLVQFNLTVPARLGTGDVPILATVGGVQTQQGVLISLQ